MSNLAGYIALQACLGSYAFAIFSRMRISSKKKIHNTVQSRV